MSISVHCLFPRDNTPLYYIFMQLAPKGWRTKTPDAHKNPGSRKTVTYIVKLDKLAPKFLKCSAHNGTAPFSFKCQQLSPPQSNLKS